VGIQVSGWKVQATKQAGQPNREHAGGCPPFDFQKSTTGDAMINFSRVAVVVLSLLLLSACGSVKVGRDFDVGVFAAKIEQGVTSQEQIRSWLGEPTSVGVSVAADGERSDEWSYYFAEGDLSDMSTAKVKILQIKFDKLGKVRSYNWSASRQ
jgi:outer membrane protein assembly factor BamE (lipoprotein component of BamABCDE complex)